MSSEHNSSWDDARVTAYVMGGLSSDEHASFETELAADESLAEAVQQATRITDQLSTLFDAETTPPLSDKHRAAIVNEPVIVRHEDEPMGRKTFIAILALAVCCLSVIGLSPLLQVGSIATLSEVSKVDSSPAASISIDEFAGEADQMSEQDAAMPPASEGEQMPETLAEENAYRESRRDEPMGWSMEDNPASSPTSPMFSASQRAPAAPFVTQSTLEKNRSRLDRSRLPETDPSIADPPDIRSDIKGVPRESASGNATAKPSSNRAAKNSREGNAATPKPSLKTQDEGLDSAAFDLEKPAYGGANPDSPHPGMKSDDSDADGVPLMPSQKNKGKESKQGFRFAKPGNAYPSTESYALKKVDHYYNTPRIIIEEEEVAQFGFDPRSDKGRSPGRAGDRFDPIVENDFIRVADHPLSTFSADVDTASYSKIRDFLMRTNRMPRPDAVRIEEMINYFDYADAPPADDAGHPFAARVNITQCPWNEHHRLARIAIKGKTLKPKERPPCNLVFLLDTSGSMNAANKLPLVVEGMKMLTGQLTKKDKVAIVVYAGSAGLVMDSTSAKKKKKIRRALENLSAGGSTNGGQGIALAYHTARENFIEGGVNRVILCTDGDFNVGTTGTDSLVRMVEKEAKDGTFLTVLGFGMGNHNDAMLEQISGRGNGNYAFIDNQREAHKVLVKQIAGTLVTIAKDVKLQVDFNPAKVFSYRLIGYENRMLAKEDFNDDKKDAGEIGAGHSVTALYELVPPEYASETKKPSVDKSKYAAKDREVESASPSDENAFDENASSKNVTEEIPQSDETLTVRIRYKQPDADTSTRVDFPTNDEGQAFKDASEDTRFTAAVAGFGMLLRRSEHSGDWEFSDAVKVAKASLGDDESELRKEFVELVKKAKQLSGR